MNPFDQAPRTSIPRPPAHTCPECKAYYTAHGDCMHTSSRHRKRQCPTPPGFWDLEMPDDPLPVEEGPVKKTPNRYDIVIPPKPPGNPLPPFKNGWTRALKPTDGAFFADGLGTKAQLPEKL